MVGRGKAKSGLDDYERALWQWVNVEDLDGFLQEVRLQMLPMDAHHMSGVRLLQGQRNLVHRTC